MLQRARGDGQLLNAYYEIWRVRVKVTSFVLLTEISDGEINNKKWYVQHLTMAVRYDRNLYNQNDPDPNRQKVLTDSSIQMHHHWFVVLFKSLGAEESIC